MNYTMFLKDLTASFLMVHRAKVGHHARGEAHERHQATSLSPATSCVEVPIASTGRWHIDETTMGNMRLIKPIVSKTIISIPDSSYINNNNKKTR